MFGVQTDGLRVLIKMLNATVDHVVFCSITSGSRHRAMSARSPWLFLASVMERLRSLTLRLMCPQPKEGEESAMGVLKLICAEPAVYTEGEIRR